MVAARSGKRHRTEARVHGLNEKSKTPRVLSETDHSRPVGTELVEVRATSSVSKVSENWV